MAQQRQISVEQPKLTKLFVQILGDLAGRKGKNRIILPEISKANLSYMKGFVQDGGLNDLPDKNDWMFIQSIDTSTNFGPQNIEKKIIIKELTKSNKAVDQPVNTKLILTPFVFSKDGDRVSFIFEDIYYPGNHSGVSLNKIILFYRFNEGKWIKVFGYPVILD